MDFGKLGKFALGCVIYGLEDMGCDDIVEDAITLLDSVNDLNESIKYIHSNTKKKKKKKKSKNECKKLFKNKNY